MRILLLAPLYLALYKPLKEEMEHQGHDVFFIEDKRLSTDCYLRNGNVLNNYIKQEYNRIFKVYEKYSDQLFEKYCELNKPFDVFFCIQGCSVCEYLVNRLKKINPSIYSVLYLWDSDRYYNFSRNIPYFDKVYSFDYEFCLSKTKVHFLPFYWQGSDEETIIKYDISCIGTDHDQRFRIIEKILPQIKSASLKYCFRIKPVGLPTGLIYYKMRLLYRKQLRQLIIDNKDCSSSEIALKNNMLPKEVEKVICESKVILDTDRDVQTGTTPRVIWALAQGKRLISTNSSLKKLPFYNSDQILIIDRYNPILDINFIKNNEFFEVHPMIKSLRIDLWIKKILNVDK